MKNFFGAIFVVLFVLAFMILLINLDGNKNKMNLIGTEPETYFEGNDGGYIPVYKIRSTAIRIENTVTVELNGNQYSCYVSPESEIQTGDMITAVFGIFEGNYELIGIN